MKKTLIILTVILAGLYVVLTVLDTSEYRLEKQIYRVQKEYNRIMADPKVVPEAEFDNLTARYQKLIAAYPESEVTPNMFLFIGALYNARGNPAKAIENFGEILKRYPDKGMLCATALLNIANTHANNKDEAKTMAAFDAIEESYADTEIGFNLPLLRANYYLNTGHKARHQEAVAKAIDYYKKKSRENPDSQVQFNALRLLVTVYYGQENWAAAVDTLEEILLTFANSQLMTQQRAALFIRSINMVCLTKLNDYRRAEKVYTRFMAEYPEHPLNKVMEQLLGAIKTLKDKNVKVTTQE